MCVERGPMAMLRWRCQCMKLPSGAGPESQRHKFGGQQNVGAIQASETVSSPGAPDGEEQRHSCSLRCSVEMQC